MLHVPEPGARHVRRYHEVMRFYLGAHHEAWLSTSDVPLFVSRRSFADRVRLPHARTGWALDSGGFTELSEYGGWTITPEQYVAEVRRIRDEVGRLEWAACMDWMCEPEILARTGLTVAEHQRRTVENYLRLLELAPDVPWVPAVQGWSSHGDHLRCCDLYEQYGVALHTLPLVGIGTICRRQNMQTAERIVRDLYERLGPRLHGFGVKLSGLRAYHTYLQSADSLAWSYGARKEACEIRNWAPESDEALGSPQNRIETALAWREQVLQAIDPYPIRRLWAAGVTPMTTTRTLRVPALATRQGPHTFFQFSMDGKQLPLVAVVSRVRRDEAGIVGYQRPEIRQHIMAIKAYIERPEAVIPNSVCLAFDERVRFVPLTETLHPENDNADAALGTLEIPIDPECPVGWMVDGQQRMAGVRDANVERFNLPCVALIADAVQQREQFMLVNTTKPLPKALLYELVPETKTLLPPQFERKRLAAEVMRRLNADEDSPFRGAIRTPTCPMGRIKDNSVLRMVEHSATEGALLEMRDFEHGVRLLKEYWTAVAETWPTAWAKDPKASRLTHGAGILAMGALMEEICRSHKATPTRAQFVAGIALIQPDTAWTEEDGAWPFGRRWHELQNTSSDIALLTRHLTRTYRDRMFAQMREAA